MTANGHWFWPRGSEPGQLFSTGYLIQMPPARAQVADTHPLPPWQLLVHGQLSKDLSDPPLLILCESVQD